MSRPLQETVFKTADGAELHYRYWPALSRAPQGAIVMFHRGHEHGGRIAHLVDELDLPDFSFFAWDARGHGKSSGERGDAPSFGTIAHDIESFIAHIAEMYGIAVQDIAVVTQSVGAVAAGAWVHDYAPKIRCMVLASPAFDVKLYVPFAKEGLALLYKLRGNFFVNSYVKSKLLTHDKARQDSYNSDPLITRQISTRILLGLYETAERVVKDARAITTPTQLLISAADWVVYTEPQHKFFVNLGSLIKERHLLSGFYHDTLGEKDRHIAVSHIRRFIRENFSRPYSSVDVTSAHISGHTRDEAETIASPPAKASFKNLYWMIYRLSLKILAKFSNGIALGHKTGFDSGSMLDYVYNNKANSIFDRVYLDAIGWKGIRQRKVHIEQMVQSVFERLRQQDHKIHVLDIAAGHGRYVLEALSRSDIKPDSIQLRDYSDINVASGKALIEEKGLSDIATFENKDAFNENDIASASPSPTLGIVSGLYELFPDNSLIERSLSGMYRAIQDGGYLIYTNQPWHPQLEMIARALTSHRKGQAWVMRRRTQNEMDQLVEKAGFKKVSQVSDEWGIFTVSLARK